VLIDTTTEQKFCRAKNATRQLKRWGVLKQSSKEENRKLGVVVTSIRIRARKKVDVGAKQRFSQEECKNQQNKEGGFKSIDIKQAQDQKDEVSEPSPLSFGTR